MNISVVGNGAGSIKTLQQVRAACAMPLTRITVGSVTMKPRAGNVGETYYFHPRERWSLNSLGLPNRGAEAMLVDLPDMIASAHSADKELWVSVAPFSPAEAGAMVTAFLSSGADGVEINASCPNVWHGTERKSIPALDPTMMVNMLWEVHNCGAYMRHVSVKLSPTRDQSTLDLLADVFLDRGVQRITCCNAIPDQRRPREDGWDALSFKSRDDDAESQHRGGLAGSLVHCDSVYVVQVMRSLLPDAEIIGIGGILSGEDAAAYARAGANGIQMTTGFLEYGGRLIIDVVSHLVSTGDIT